jgi:DNA polymerase I
MKLYVVDAYNWIFRSYFALPEMSNDKGEATHGIFGFVRSLHKLIKDFSPTHIAVVWDGPRGKEKRTAIYADYKAHREAAPEDLPGQVERVKRFCTLMGLPQLCVEGVEADDTMGTLAHHLGKGENEVYLCTSDKDMCQLVNDNVFVLKTHHDNLVVDAAGVRKQFGVEPSQIIDLLAMMGDSSDNIPGLPGFGPKTAATLLQSMGSLDYILAHPEEVPGKKKRETIEQDADLARLSRELATIYLDVDVPRKMDAYCVGEPNMEGLTSFYREFGFKALLKEVTPRQESSGKYHLVEDLEQLTDLLQGEIAFDTETTDLRPLQAELVGIGFCIKEGEAWYVPITLGREKVIKALKPLFADPKRSFIAHNAKYDAHVLLNCGIEVSNIGWDTLLASYTLRAHERAHSLDHLALTYFDKVKTPITDLIGKGKNQKSMLDVPVEQVADYCGEDVDYTFRLKGRLQEELKERGLTPVFEEIEMPLLPVLLKMERRGMFVDRERLEKMSGELTRAVKVLVEEIHDMAGEEFNVSSPKQLSQILFEKMGIKPPKKTATGYSTNAEVLEGLAADYPIATKVLEYRQLEKLRSTYVDTLPGQIDPDTGRVHPTFNQYGAATGRLSCSDPNLQNIPVRSPIGREIRAAFRPEKKGWLYLSADYSQIELRLLAHMSEDPGLLQAFQQGEDVHVATAASVFGVPLEKVTKEQRFQAKAVNFGIIYGQQAFGLGRQLGIHPKEAGKFIERYFEKYPKVKAFVDRCQERAREEKRAVTLFGRERLLPEIDSRNPSIRTAAERLAVNTPLQGTAADLIKIAMIEMEQKLAKMESMMILQIHDELLFEAPHEEMETLKPLVRKTMEGALDLKIPLVVDLAVGKNWKEC